MRKLLTTVMSVGKQEPSQSSQPRVRRKPGTILGSLDNCTCANGCICSGKEARHSPLLPQDHTSRREVILARILQLKVWLSVEHFLMNAGRCNGSGLRKIS